MAGDLLERSVLEVDGVKADIATGGKGRTLLYLHSELSPVAEEPFVNALARDFRVVAPTLPGFGTSELPYRFTNVDDLAYFVLDIVEKLDLRDVTLAGASFGGWVAAAIAIKASERFTRCALINPVGIKVGDRLTRDLEDVFSMTDTDFAEKGFRDSTFAPQPNRDLSEEELTGYFRNRETLAIYAWSPYMHDPKLRQRLHRISVPTLLLWGSDDKIAPKSYVEKYARMIPGATFETIADAGHFPQIERPDAVAARIAAFGK
jgi:pimeloyl-ACP methyl ester carboxylesterase